jgi:DNA polymerase-4/DNA polymerase V
MNLYNEPFPRAILHVDGDSFFVACELTKFPELKGLPVVTGSEKGIASAMSIEAKARGITRGMPVHMMKKVCPEVVMLHSDFALYEHYSERMVTIIKRYTHKVEAYSIDECFIDLTGLDEELHLSYREIAERIKRDLESELGITFSLGVSMNKTLAKVASHFAKPAGITLIAPFEINHYLSRHSIGDVWGIGKRTTGDLKGWSIHTALDLAQKDKRFLVRHFTKPLQITAEELTGVYVLQVNYTARRDYQSMSKTQTLGTPTTNREMVFSELSRNVERVCKTLRSRKMFAAKVSIFIKTQTFEYCTTDFELPYAVANPSEIMKHLREHFNTLFQQGILYRATGVTVSQLTRSPHETLNLFGEERNRKQYEALYNSLDKINHKFGRSAVLLASSHTRLFHCDKRQPVSPMERLTIPLLGVVY